MTRLSDEAVPLICWLWKIWRTNSGILFWPAAIGAAWFGGIGPAVVSSAFSVFLADYFFIGSRHELSPGSPDNLIPFAVFLFGSFSVAVLPHATRLAAPVIVRLAGGAYSRLLPASATAAGYSPCCWLLAAIQRCRQLPPSPVAPPPSPRLTSSL